MIEHQFELLFTVPARSDKTHYAVMIRAGWVQGSQLRARTQAGERSEEDH